MKKVLTFLLVVVLALSCASFAAATEVTDVELVSSGTVELDGTNNGTVTTSLQATKPQTFYALQGHFSLKETADSNYFKLTSYTLNAMPALGPYDETSVDTGNLYWKNINNPISAQIGTKFLTATYTVDKDTPAGTYYLTYENEVLTGDKMDSNEDEHTYTVAITVTRAGASTGAEITGASGVTVGATAQLAVKLLPENTTETITNVVWSSSSANATVNASTGLVTGVSVGSAVITATVTTSGGATWTATHSVTVTAAKTYTVKAAASAAKVYPDDTVTVTVTVCDNAFEGAEAVLTYDTALFTYVSASDTLTGTTVQPASGSVKLQFSSTTPAAAGSALARLTFRANAVSATGRGTFGFSAAKAGETAPTYTGNWPAAATETAAVSVVKQFAVCFLDRDGAQIGDSVLVDQGGSVTAVPTAPEVDYHDFRAWTAGGVDYTAEQIGAAAVTADVSYQAAYTPKTYAVTVPDTLNAAASATYGSNYAGTIKNYDGTNYDYTVEFSADGATWTEASVNADAFTVPGEAVTGDLTLRLTRTIKGVELKTVADYVDGWTLVLVKGTPGTKYSFDGNAMFSDAYSLDEKDYSFAWLIEGAAPENVGDLIAISDADPVAIPTGFDVNATGSVSYEDVQAAFGVMNKVSAPGVELMLRADVNRDGKVDAADLSTILAYSGYTF